MYNELWLYCWWSKQQTKSWWKVDRNQTEGKN